MADSPPNPSPGREPLARDAYIIPGLVDAHCHIGLGVMGAVSVEEARRQARADLAAGTMLIRDAGSPSDTRWVQQDETLPRLIRAAGTSPAPVATSAIWPSRWNPRPSSSRYATRPTTVTAGLSSSVTGSTAQRAISNPPSRPPWRPRRSRSPTRRRPGHRPLFRGTIRRRTGGGRD